MCYCVSSILFHPAQCCQIPQFTVLTVKFFLWQQTNKHTEKRGHVRLPTLTSTFLRNSSTSWSAGIHQGSRAAGSVLKLQEVNTEPETLESVVIMKQTVNSFNKRWGRVLIKNWRLTRGRECAVTNRKSLLTQNNTKPRTVTTHSEAEQRGELGISADEDPAASWGWVRLIV